jgi:hypothetical protein
VAPTDTSAFWGGFENSDQTELRTGKVAAEVARSPQQQPTTQDALIGRLQQRASRGDDDALATLRMLDSMHGAYSSNSSNSSGMPVRMSESPPVEKRVWPDAGSCSPETMFEVPSATHLALAHLTHLASRGTRPRCQHSECSRQFG